MKALGTSLVALIVCGVLATVAQVAQGVSLNLYVNSAAYGSPDGGLTLALLGGALVGVAMLQRKFAA